MPSSLLMRRISRIISFLRCSFCRAKSLWRSQRQQQDLSNLLFSKGVSRIQKVLKKQKQLSRQELEEAVKDLYAKQPFSSERIQVTDPKQFLDSLLPYMLRQHLISEIRQNHQTYYMIRK